MMVVVKPSIVYMARGGEVTESNSFLKHELYNRQKAPSFGEFVQISEFQEMMKQLYFKRDCARGANGTYNWLLDEVAELGEELKGSDKEATEKEFADVIAWLASLANVMGIDLERATLNKYNSKCPKCQKSPCQCTFKLSKTPLP